MLAWENGADLGVHLVQGGWGFRSRLGSREALHQRDVKMVKVAHSPTWSFFVTPPSFQSRYLNYKLWQKLSNEYNTDQYHEESHESQDNRNFNLKQMIY